MSKRVTKKSQMPQPSTSSNCGCGCFPKRKK